MAGKNNRKHGRNKNSHANMRYKAEGRLLKNKKRNVATEELRQMRDADKRSDRAMRRARGAVARLERRLKEAHKEGKPTGVLYESMKKAERAYYYAAVDMTDGV